jgi:WD40 repeat protein
MAFNRDGTRLVAGQDQGRIRILDAATLKVLDVLYGHAEWVKAVGISPDEAHLASASSDGTMRLWNLASGEVVRVFAGFPRNLAASSLAFSADGAFLAAGSTAGARLWRLDGDASRVLQGHHTYVYLVTFSPDGTLIASSAFHGNVRLWDALTGELLAELPGAKPHYFLSFAPDGARLVASDSHEGAAVWDPAAAARLTAPRTASDEALFDALTGSNQSGREFGYARAAAGGARATGLPCPSAASSLDRTLLAHILRSGEIRIVDLATGKTTGQIDQQAAQFSVVAFNPDGTQLLVGDEEGALTVWDVAAGTKLRTMTGHLDEVYCVSYNPDGSRIASGGDDCSIILWDTESSEQVLTLLGHDSYVHSVAFSPDGTMLASASGDGTVRIWDSISPAERWRQIQDAKELRREARPLVARLLAELGGPLDVADHIRGDDTLTDDFRRAALRELLEQSQAGSTEP